MKKFDLKKEEYRGSIKQLMTVRGLRMINIANFNAWSGNVMPKLENVHSVKIDIMNGFVNLYAPGKGGRAGNRIDDVSAAIYKKVYERVLEIFKTELDIPADVRRNILVRVSR
jgi:hypothetical protein